MNCRIRLDRLVAEDLPLRLVEDAENRLGPLAGRHLARPEDEGLRRAVRAAQDVRDGLDPEVPSVPRRYRYSADAGLSRHRAAPELLGEHLAVVGVNEVERVRAEELGRRPARDDLVRRADELESPEEVELADHVDHVVRQPLQVRLGDVRAFAARDACVTSRMTVMTARRVGTMRASKPAARLHLERVLERCVVPGGGRLDLLEPERATGAGRNSGIVRPRSSSRLDEDLGRFAWISR